MSHSADFSRRWGNRQPSLANQGQETDDECSEVLPRAPVYSENSRKRGVNGCFPGDSSPGSNLASGIACPGDIPVWAKNKSKQALSNEVIFEVASTVSQLKALFFRLSTICEVVYFVSSFWSKQALLDLDCATPFQVR